MTADLQARRRLGLTATLVREDGREGDVFSPDRAQALRRAVEGHRGAGLHRAGRLRRGAGDADRRRAAGLRDRRAGGAVPALRDDRDARREVVEALVAQHEGEPTLVIGQYLDQLDELGEHLDAPVITGETTVNASASSSSTRSAPGEITVLVVCKVANFSIDLPEATVAIQVSGTFGSRQEEAQRLGRVLRPKADGRDGALLHGGRARHRRPGLRRPPPALPGRAGLRLPDRRRRRRPGLVSAETDQPERRRARAGANQRPWHPGQDRVPVRSGEQRASAHAGLPPAGRRPSTPRRASRSAAGRAWSRSTPPGCRGTTTPPAAGVRPPSRWRRSPHSGPPRRTGRSRSRCPGSSSRRRTGAARDRRTPARSPGTRSAPAPSPGTPAIRRPYS